MLGSVAVSQEPDRSAAEDLHRDSIDHIAEICASPGATPHPATLAYIAAARADPGRQAFLASLADPPPADDRIRHQWVRVRTWEMDPVPAGVEAAYQCANCKEFTVFAKRDWRRCCPPAGFCGEDDPA